MLKLHTAYVMIDAMFLHEMINQNIREGMSFLMLLGCHRADNLMT